MELYVNDIITKSSKEINHVRSLKGPSLLRHYEMKLNPKKCTFGVRFEKSLEYMINQKGI